MPDTDVFQINLYSMHLDKCKSAFKCIHLVNLFNLFLLDVVQKCQYCQLCVLRENSNICYQGGHEERIVCVIF